MYVLICWCSRDLRYTLLSLFSREQTELACACSHPSTSRVPPATCATCHPPFDKGKGPKQSRMAEKSLICSVCVQLHPQANRQVSSQRQSQTAHRPHSPPHTTSSQILRVSGERRWQRSYENRRPTSQLPQAASRCFCAGVPCKPGASLYRSPRLGCCLQMPDWPISWRGMICMC